MMARVIDLPPHMPADARPSAVLLLLFPKNETLHLLLIKRTEDGRAHSGQISFPGGKKEPADIDLQTTAIREANEETGILKEDVEILGELSPLYIPVSNFLVHPFVAFAEKQPEFFPNADEVAYVIETPLQYFLTEKNKTIARVTSPADKHFVRDVKAYKLADGSILWGATAMILSELETLFEEL